MDAETRAPVWNVPQHLLAEFSIGNRVVRVTDAEAIPDLPTPRENGSIVAVEVRALPENIEDLAERLRATDIPIDLVLTDPGRDAAQLYRLARLCNDRWVRVTIPVVPGFSRAVRIATSLQLGVRLAIGQPDAALVDELLSVVEHYVHRPDVDVPVEFLHSLLAVFLGESNACLWDICEDDPAFDHYVSDDGRILSSARFEAAEATDDPSGILPALLTELDASGAECVGCRYRDVCVGYFKVPDRTYSCEHVIRVFAALEQAAGELIADVRTYGEEVR